MKVVIRDLFKGTNHWKTSKQAELAVLRWRAKQLGLDPNTVVVDLNEGYNPLEDGTTAGTVRNEVKFTSQETFKCEFARANGRPSGLLLSQADIYTVISPGWSRINGEYKRVGKVRDLRRTDLLRILIERLPNRLYITTQPNNDGPGSRSIVIDCKKDIDNVWVGDVEVEGTGTSTTYTIPEVQETQEDIQ